MENEKNEFGGVNPQISADNAKNNAPEQGTEDVAGNVVADGDNAGVVDGNGVENGASTDLVGNAREVKPEGVGSEKDSGIDGEGNGSENGENGFNGGKNSFGGSENFWGSDVNTGGMGGAFPNPPRPSFSEAPNAAEVLNSYLFGTSDTKKVNPPKKDSPALKKIIKSACVIFLALAVSFSGAFTCFYWVCRTALLGDSDFFRTLMLQGSGITVNQVEVDKISGSYEEDTIALSEKISQCSVDLQIFTESGERAGSGSGVILSADGLAITNYHVVYGYEKSIKAVLSDGTVCTVSVLHLDKISDLAVIKVNTDKSLTPAVWGDSTKVKKGQSIAICGNPLGLGGSVSFGKISHPDRDLGEVAGNFIQLDATVNPGNSGGGVFDGAGNLIGIVNSKASGSNVDGIGYAIPAERAMDVVNQLFKNGYVSGRPAIGFTLVQVNQSTWEYFKNGDGTSQGELKDYLYEAKYGIYIIESKYNTEIIKGDRIVSCNGIAFDDRDNFSSWLMKYKPGDTVRITVERVPQPATQNPDGTYVRQQLTFECTLQQRDWADEPYQK